MICFLTLNLLIGRILSIVVDLNKKMQRLVPKDYDTRNGMSARATEVLFLFYGGFDVAEATIGFPVKLFTSERNRRRSRMFNPRSC